MIGDVQLSFEVDGLDPYELAQLDAPAHGALYEALDLTPLQIACAEDATRRVLAGEYGVGR